MAQLRTALRAYAAEGHDPASVVQAVDRLMWQLGPTAMTTLAYLVLDPIEETLEVVNAGHLPPLIDRRRRRAALPAASGRPCHSARRPAEIYRSQVVPFPAGTRWCCTPTGSWSAAARRSTSASTGCASSAPAPTTSGGCAPQALDAARAAGAGRRRRARRRAHAAAQRRPAHDLAGDARESLVGVRRILRRWLAVPRRRRGGDRTTSWSPAQEACANAVEHAYGPGQAHFDVDAAHREAQIRVTVRDRGRWRPPRGSHRGRGLPLMRALMESVDVEHGEEGTVVVLERTLRPRSAA